MRLLVVCKDETAVLTIINADPKIKQNVVRRFIREFSELT